MLSTRTALSLIGLTGLLFSAACAQVLGLDKYTEGAGGGSTSTTTGTGGNPPITCSPGEVKACPYKGPGMTENRGVCKAGTQTCLPNGSGFGDCTGEVDPTTEDCATPDDEDCDGTVNQPSAGCVCTPGKMEACYDGDPTKKNTGICHEGTHTCKPDGKGWGTCDGEVLPQKSEDCATQADDNCDGTANEGCPCTPNSTEACYTGDPATKGKGICTDGMWTCKGDGSGYGACMGEVLPAASDDCSNNVDEDCSGTYCTEPVWVSSYSNPMIYDHTTDSAGNSYITGVFFGSLKLANPPLISAGGTDRFVAKIDASGAPVWAIRFGDVQNQEGRGIALDSAGNVLIVGSFRNSVTFGAIVLGGPTNDSDQIFVAKLDNGGNAIWAREFGDPAGSIANQNGLAVAVDAADNVIFAGKFANQVSLGSGNAIPVKGNIDTFVAKLDKTGMTTLYAKTYGGAGVTTIPSRVAVDSGGNAAVIGAFTGSVNFGFGAPTAANANGPDAYLLRLSPAGGSSWLKTFGNGKQIYFSDVKIDGSGNTDLLGGFQGTINVGSKSLTVPMSGVQSNVFLAQLDALGTTAWAMQFGNTMANANGSSSGRNLAVDAGGNVLFSGTCYGTFDVGFSLGCDPIAPTQFLLMTSGGGLPLWGRAFVGNGLLKTVSFGMAPFATVVGSSVGALDLGKGAIPAGGFVAEIATK
ncbi:MAG: hypothetical protein U0359_27225 [Byssovorax sp.]